MCTLMKVSVSRSVGRAFAVMELFREAQAPANATELSRRLGAPHSSVVAVLHNLRELGYLSFDDVDMTFFPTTKMLSLGAWLRPAPWDQGMLSALVERVARDTGHMTALSSRLSLFVNTVLLRPGRYSNVAAPARSVGAALTHSVAGHIILSQLDDSALADILRETESWMRSAGVRNAFDKAALLSNVALARRKGFLTGAHPSCRGTEIISYAVKGAAASPCALSVHIPTCLSRDGKDAVWQFLEAGVRDSVREAGLPPRPLRPVPPPQAARRPPGRAPEFGGLFSPVSQDGMAPRRMLATHQGAR